MKQILLIGFIILCLSEMSVGIHLRHESNNQRKKNSQVSIEDLKGKDYASFVEKLNETLAQKMNNYDFRTQLMNTIEAQTDKLSLSKSNIQNLTESFETKWVGKDNVDKLNFVKGKLMSIPVKNLKPSQSEIGLQNSLDYPLNKLSEKEVDDLFNGEPQMIVSPIVTYNQKYVIDGHHRWSQLFMVNPNATIVAYNIDSKEGEDSESILRRLQVAIAIFFGHIPSASGDFTVDVYDGAEKKDKTMTFSKRIDEYLKCRFRKDEPNKECENLLKAQKEQYPKDDEGKNKPLPKISDEFIKSFQKHSETYLEDKYKNSDVNTQVYQKLLRNIHYFVEQTMEPDHKSKPKRNIMPQTDGPKDVKEDKVFIKEGLIPAKDNKIMTIPAILNYLVKHSMNMKRSN